MQPIRRISVCALSVLALLPAAQSQPTHRLSFDPTPPGACETELGHGPASDWVGDVRGFALQCADEDTRRENAELASLDAAAAKSGTAQAQAWHALAAAFQDYRKQWMGLQTVECGGGNGCGADMAIKAALLNFQFLRMAEGFRGAALPSFSDADAATADKALNTAYQQALAQHPPQCPASGSDNYDEGCIPQSALRACQRAWLRYRDAWIAWAALKWPRVSAATWRTHLANEETRNQF